MYYLEISVAPPFLFELAGDPVRWGLLRELADGDRRVGELCELVGRPQNLVSYHLGRLRAGGIVTSRRSAADGRDWYYQLDLPGYHELLADSGRALHPGLRVSPAAAGLTRPVRLLFLCTGNSARSQIAQAFAEQSGGGLVAAESAGSHPKPLHPNAVRALRSYGIDVSTRSSKHFDQFARVRFDAVVTLCDRVREVCPEFPGSPHPIHWSIPDPASSTDPDLDTYPAFERVARDISTRVQFLLARIAQTQSTEEVI